MTGFRDVIAEIATIVFAASICLLLLIYFGYPLLLRLLPARRPSPSHDTEPYDISIVIVARNEAKNLPKKIHNLLNQSIESKISEIIVVSDNSSDDTVHIVSRMAADEPRIKLLELNAESGKAAGLNLGVRHASGRYLVFSDTRQRFQDNAIERLIANFADPAVGGVCGELRISAGQNILGAYWKFETLIRRLESRVDSVVGCTGAIYAIRRDLYTETPADLILDDIWIPAHVVFQGYRVIYEPRSIAVEQQEFERSDEFRRKVRTLAGNYQLVHLSRQFVLPKQNRLWWSFVLHKLARLFGPVLLVLALLSAFFLPPPLGAALVAGQVLAYSAAAASNFISPLNQHCRLCRICEAFVILNLAAAVAMVKAIKGDYQSLWTAPRSGGSPAS